MDEGRSLGLMIRGGAEYGLGIYVTGVDPGSAAHAGALKVPQNLSRGLLLSPLVASSCLGEAPKLTHLSLPLAAKALNGLASAARPPAVTGQERCF